MTSFTGRTPASSYQELLKLQTGVVGSEPTLIVDGLGHTTTLGLSATTVAINGLAFPTGTPSVGQVLTVGASNQLAWQSIDSGVTPQQRQLLNGITVSSTEINYLSGVTTSIQNQINGLNASISTNTSSINSLGTRTTTLEQTVAAIDTREYGATTITLNGDISGYWAKTPQNPNSAVLSVALATVGSATTFNYASVDTKGRVLNAQTKSYWDLSTDASTASRLSLTSTPTQPSHAANKAYVDSVLSTGLPNTGTPGSYVKITTDAQGRVTSGVASLAISGDVTGSMTTTGATLSLSVIGSGGTFKSVTVDTKGRVTGGTNPTTLAGYGITDALKLSGGALTGALTLSGAPTVDLQATTKKYVDDSIADAVIEASAGNLTYHQALQGLQGGTTNEYFHLTDSEHSQTQLMVAEYTTNGSQFVTSSQKLVLNAFNGANGQVLVNGGVVTISNDLLLATDQTYGLGTITFTNPSIPGTQTVLRRSEIAFSKSTNALVLRGFSQNDPYGLVGPVATYPRIQFKQNDTNTVEILATNTALSINNASSIYSTAATTLGSLTTGAGTFSSISVSGVATLGLNSTVAGTPTSTTHIANKSYVDSAINTALSGTGNHNLLSNLQGGTTNEYYHLTSTQYTAVSNYASVLNSGLMARRDVNNNFTASQSFGGLRLQAVADPTANQDAATKNYVDNKFTTEAGWATRTYVLPIACSDEITAISTGTAKVTFRMPFAMTDVTVRASLTTAQTSGSIFTVDVNESGVSILSTKLTIDNTEKSSVTAATPAVFSKTSLADDAEITIDVDQIGSGTATGLKVYLIGTI